MKLDIDFLTNINVKVMVDGFMWECELYLLMVTHFAYIMRSAKVRNFFYAMQSSTILLIALLHYLRSAKCNDIENCVSALVVKCEVQLTECKVWITKMIVKMQCSQITTKCKPRTKREVQRKAMERWLSLCK